MNTKNTLASNAHSFNPGQIVFTILALLVIVSFTSLSYAEYPSPLKQINAGVAPENIQCNADRIHVVRDNGNHACVTEKTAERTGWEIISKVSTVTSEQPTTIEFDTASTLEFVDDGREYPQALQRAPAPHIVYDKIIASELNPNNIGSAKSLSFESAPHEKFSYTSGIGFHVEDFMPSYIPDGQKLLYAENMCFESGTCWLTIQFVPSNFEFDTRTTNHDIQVSKGFKIFAEYDVEGVDQVEDIVETITERRAEQPRNYGGFIDMDFGDGKEGYAFEGGNGLNYYKAYIHQQLDEYSHFAVISYYHTYDEILPIFKSIVN